MTDVRALHDAVWAKLDAVVGVNAYDGEIVDAEGNPVNPPADDLGRVDAYAVLYVSPGSRYASALNGAQTSLGGSFQVTCVGGDPAVALWCVDEVRDGLVGATITIAGRTHVIRADDVDPGPLRRDDDKKPPRHYVPLGFRVFIP